MKQVLMFITLLLLVSGNILSQGYKTEALSNDIRTIQVNAQGDWQRLPVIGNGEFVRINFDRVGENEAKDLRYRVVYCDADWKLSSLMDIEFMDGFNNVLIEDYGYSTNTIVDYTNFMIDIPNERIKLKLSGNYAVEVFETGNPSEVLMRACFSVLDPQIMLRGKVSSVTDIDANKEYQQLSFSIDYNNLNVRDVFSDLKVFVRQNNRQDNQRSYVKPTYIEGNRLIYGHNRDLIFEAGNEYRRFESVSYRYNGLHIERTEYRNAFYHTTIVPDKIKAGKVYSYDQDQDGRFRIRNAEVEDSDTGADYFVTTFKLLAPDPFIEPIYLNGEFTGNIFDDRYLMTYDATEGAYKTSLLLKQGAYNYQYLAKSGDKYTPLITEGNYYETENEYTVYVYYRPIGKRYDLLVGMLLMNNR